MQLHFIIFSILILPCLLEARLTSRENRKDFETIVAKNKPFHLFSHRRGTKSPVTRHRGVFSPKQLKISRSNPSHKVLFIHRGSPSCKSKHHLQDHPPQFTRKSPFLSNAWSPLSKTSLAIRKRTARAEEHAAEHDEKLDTASQTRKEKISVEDDSPNISTAMVDMKELLQKLMEKAESDGELNTVDVTAPPSDVISAPSDVTNLYDAPLQESQLSSNARGNIPASDLKTVRNQVTSDVPPVTSDPMTSHPLDTTAAAVPPVSNHHMGFNRGPLPNVQLGMKASALPPSSEAAKSTAHAPDSTPELDTTPFRPMKLPASVASPPAEVPSIEPDSEGGWSVSLAGFGGGSQDFTNSDNSVNKLVNSAGTPASDNSLHSTNADQHVEVLDGIEAPDDDPEDGSNCTFDPMEEGEPVGPQMSPRMQLQAMTQTVAQTMLQNAGVPRVNPKPQPVTELERQPLLKPEPQPLPDSGSRGAAITDGGGRFYDAVVWGMSALSL
ncbi:uncharacterized protein LOC122373165 [Amphibalanus amphitrite]|uniref:uncharacterized protein LOC122373165 n=1 Tax=Amphibalanus amphitrite TaxID=1232801 RepID=UPI001C9152BC|nr:uncharacterized protein LOC122373165 [Amphibalanus amphitrite]